MGDRDDVGRSVPHEPLLRDHLAFPHMSLEIGKGIWRDL
jgi:hypothetical protein